jgi:hypothetical protein
MICRRKILFLVLLAGSVFAGVSCIDPIVPDLKEEDTRPVMVVDGKITDVEGPFRIKLSQSVRMDVLYYFDPVTDADVKIFDDKGNLFYLYSSGDGLYETLEKNLKAIPGNSYALSITTPDGREYLSTAVKMEPVTEIDSLYFEEEIKSVRTDNETREENWLNILLDTHDPDNRIKYWYYEFVETWEIKLLTGDILIQHSPPGTPSDITRESVTVSEDKLLCWVTKNSNSVLIASTVNSPVNEIKRFPVQSLGPDQEKLHLSYSILVKQSSISQDLYDYWKLMKDVNENSGGLYEKMPAQIYGNISCCDGTSRILGYFSAMSVKEKRIFIDKKDHNVRTVSAFEGCIYNDFGPIPFVPTFYFGKGTVSGKDIYCTSEYCNDCRTSGTNVKPDFWK